MWPLALAGGFFYIVACKFMVYNQYIGQYLNNRQGTFLHQARLAKVQERRQQGTLYEI
jgi:hypothetical protein